ncbi:hypothetical protein IFM89_001340 [Coptis chinensis]|uniref:Uncharacterized protein n=1 Tax=Coptis chinensis TaxID=261450 RepID=A0A835LAM4_9MAGN|nr:hypothetical protein IFM89_001340 [Coptis chinensis]
MVKAKLCSMELDHDNIEESCAAVITMLKARVNSRVFMEVVLKNDKLRTTSCRKCRELCFIEIERGDGSGGDGSGNHEHLETDWPPPSYEHVERSARGKNVLIAPARGPTLEADAPPPGFEHLVRSARGKNVLVAPARVPVPALVPTPVPAPARGFGRSSTRVLPLTAQRPQAAP